MSFNGKFTVMFVTQNHRRMGTYLGDIADALDENAGYYNDFVRILSTVGNHPDQREKLELINQFMDLSKLKVKLIAGPSVFKSISRMNEAAMIGLCAGFFQVDDIDLLNEEYTRQILSADKNEEDVNKIKLIMTTIHFLLKMNSQNVPSLRKLCECFVHYKLIGPQITFQGYLLALWILTKTVQMPEESRTGFLNVMVRSPYLHARRNIFSHCGLPSDLPVMTFLSNERKDELETDYQFGKGRKISRENRILGEKITKAIKDFKITERLFYTKGEKTFPVLLDGSHTDLFGLTIEKSLLDFDERNAMSKENFYLNGYKFTGLANFNKHSCELGGSKTDLDFRRTHLANLMEVSQMYSTD